MLTSGALANPVVSVMRAFPERRERPAATMEALGDEARLISAEWLMASTEQYAVEA